MKLETLEILRCPVCKGELNLEIIEKRDEIIKGTLTCIKCGRIYGIEDGIPMLLPELAGMKKND
ncbi:MAG: Trm112 family protein [Thermoplasmata archaeon]|nr:Trm112 family protein [Thermoplasmata archaeon]